MRFLLRPRPYSFAAAGGLALLVLGAPLAASDAEYTESAAALGPATPAAEPDQQLYSPIAIDRPVGSVRLAKAGDALGERRYMARSDAQGVVTVAFARSLPARTAGRGGIGGVPTGLPLGNARLTSGFGYRFHPMSGRYHIHTGVDLAAPTGTPVVATADGVVSLAGWIDGYGITIALDHGRDVETRYAHLSAIAITRGEPVKQGQIIGYVGSTGRSTGPHLHYEVRKGQVATDPLR